MTPPAPYRKGWCPGALSAMESGDGLLVRVRPSGGRLTLDQAEAIADAARECGNGAIALSLRANLQIRGVSEETLPALRARIGAAGLLDRDPEIERLRNVVASPLSDIDPESAFDCTPALNALETRLAHDMSLRCLPPKFGFVLDVGGRLPLGDVDADIRLEAAPDLGSNHFAVYCAGDDGRAASCASEDVGETAARLAKAFLDQADNVEARRMRGVVQRSGSAVIFARAALATLGRPRSKRSPSLTNILGAHSLGSMALAGTAAPFGEIDAASFKALVGRARESGGKGLRLAPQRVVLVVGLAPERAASLVSEAAAFGLIVAGDDRRLSVAACVGAPACLHAARPVRPEAARWIELLPRSTGVVLHVSGCAKGCARSSPTAATLVATEAGYDLVIGGKAGDPPLKRGLVAADVSRFLEGMTWG